MGFSNSRNIFPPVTHFNLVEIQFFNDPVFLSF